MLAEDPAVPRNQHGAREQAGGRQTARVGDETIGDGLVRERRIDGGQRRPCDHDSLDAVRPLGFDVHSENCTPLDGNRVLDDRLDGAGAEDAMSTTHMPPRACQSMNERIRSPSGSRLAFAGE